MPRIEVEDGDLVLILSSLEKVISFSVNLRVPVALVQSVEEVRHAGSTSRGMLAFVPMQRFGTIMPGLLIYGSSLTVAGLDLFAVIGDRPGVRVDFGDGSPVKRLIASVSDPEATVDAIRSALSDRP